MAVKTHGVDVGVFTGVPIAHPPTGAGLSVK
jgi:hypothetical protein